MKVHFETASTWDVPDMEAFHAAQGSFSPELVATAERAGMIPSTIDIKEQTGRVRDAQATASPGISEAAALAGFAQRTYPNTRHPSVVVPSEAGSRLPVRSREACRRP